MDYFTFQQNRSERAKQVDLLVPALTNKQTRFRLLSIVDIKGDYITKKESDESIIMNFVWVLRDTFYWERDKASKTKNWKMLRNNWVKILGLGDWATEPIWWSHPSGSYNGDSDYVVHPCSRQIGWTEVALRDKLEKYSKQIEYEKISKLVEIREVMNTECDCLIQSPKRLIVVECKDKTSFSNEQKNRQAKLRECFERLFNPKKVTYVEVDSSNKFTKPQKAWSWQNIEDILVNKD